MHRIVGLTVLLILLSCGSASAGMMSAPGSTEAADDVVTASIADWLLAATTDRVSVPAKIDAESGLAGSTPSTGGHVIGFGNGQLAPRFELAVSTVRVSIDDHLLPPSPDLMGLIKPPRS